MAQTAGTIREGALLGNTLLPEKEFKAVLLEALNNHSYEKQIIDAFNRIKTITDKYDQGNYDDDNLYNAVSDLQTRLFKNAPVSLMVIGNINSSHKAKEYVWGYEEKEVVSNRQVVQYSDALKNKCKQLENLQKAEDIISRHLRQMITYINTTKVPKNFDELAFGVKQNRKVVTPPTFQMGKGMKRSMGERLSSTKISKNQKTIGYIFYGKSEVSEGMIADAFLNHLGRMHHQLFLNEAFVSNKLPTVLQEEGQDSFFQLLANSVNKTGWYTGGDLVLISGNEVIANIQLKTIQNLKEIKQQGSELAYKEIKKRVTLLQSTYNKTSIKDKEAFVKRVYNLFKTSAIIHEVEKEIEEIPMDFAKENLKAIKAKNGVTINVTFT